MSELLHQHELAELFNQLTPERVLDAVEAIGRRCSGRFIILNSYENRVYQLEMEDGDWVVGKFYRPGRWSLETILAEHEFVAELASSGVPSVNPLPINGGAPIGEIEGIFYSIYPRIGGRSPEEFTDEQLQIMGRLAARLHNVGDLHGTPHRMELSGDTFGKHNLAYLLENDIIPPEARENYAATLEQLLSLIEPLFLQVPTHRIHGDCHRGNILWTGKGPCFLDFDDMVIGPAVQDVWLIVPSFDEEGQRQRNVLLESYVQFREFNPSWLRLVEPLRALRYVHYSTWIAKRWHDPIFQRTFSHFGTLQYWQREIQDLREQIGRIVDLH